MVLMNSTGELVADRLFDSKYVRCVFFTSDSS